MRSTALALVAAASMAAISCTTLADQPASGGQIRTDGSARLSESTRVGPLVVTPKRLVEDSRCPADAQCVWAGRLVLLTQIDGPGWRQTIPLALGEDQPIGGYVIRLATAQPLPESGKQIAPETYVFGFQLR